MKRRLLVAAALCALPLLLHAAPRERAQSRPGADLPVRLAELLRKLDDDQSRRLSRQIEPAQSVFTQADLGDVAKQLESHRGRALIVIGKRGPLPDSPLEIERVLEVAPRPEGGPAPRSKASRTAYVPANAGANWMPALTALESPPTEQVSAAAALDVLSKSRDAAFVFLLRGEGTAARSSLEKLVLVPDTVKVTITGSAVVGGPTVSTQRRRPPPPDRNAGTEMGYPRPPPPSFETMTPIEEPELVTEEVPQPVEESVEE